MLVGLLGILKAGGAYLPLDPAYPAERLGFMLADTAAPILLTQSSLHLAALKDRIANPNRTPAENGCTLACSRHETACYAPGTAIAAPARTTICLDADWPTIARHPATAPAVTLHPHHTAYVIYTSGSTGTPKGVAVSHGGIPNLAAVQIERFGITPSSRVLQFASASFDAAIWEIASGLVAGARRWCCALPMTMGQGSNA